MASTEIVDTDDKVFARIERPAGADHVVPPAGVIIALAVLAGDMMGARQRMTNQDGIGLFGIELTVSLINQIVGRQHRAGLQNQGFAEVGQLRGDDADRRIFTHAWIILRSMQNHPNISAYLGRSPQLGRDVHIDQTARVIGDVTLGDDASVWPGVVIRGDVNHIRIGTGSNIQDLSVLHVSHQSSWDPAGAPLLIGSQVTIGHRVILHGCTIADECLIGMGAIIMDKVVIEPRVLVGAGSLVPEGKVLQSGYLYLGSPVRRVRALTEQELAHFSYSAQHYIRLKNNYMASGSEADRV